MTRGSTLLSSPKTNNTFAPSPYQQAAGLNIAIEDFGGHALSSSQPVRIAGRCGVFAESDMIHKQQMDYPIGDIIMGLCEALVRNYLNNVAKGM